MSDPKKDSPAQDESNDDLLAGVEEHLQDPDEGAKLAGEEREDEPEESQDESETDNQEDEGESAEPGAEEEAEPHLKQVVGKQANEIGELRRQLREMEAKLAPKEEPAVDPAAAQWQAMRERWGDALVNDLQQAISVSVAPIKQVTAIAQMRERYSDFDDVRGDMEEILKSQPALANAAKSDDRVLDTVYLAAKAKRGSVSSADSARREGARSQEVERQKKAAFVEKPSPKTPPPKKPTTADWEKGFVDHLMSLTPDGRDVPRK